MSKQIIAVVGVSQNPEKYGHKIFRDLLPTDNTIYGINPNAHSILDQKIYSSLEELPELPDLVMTVVPPQVTEQIVEKCSELGIKRIWMQPGSESTDAVQKALQLGLDVTSNTCFMKAEHIW